VERDKIKSSETQQHETQTLRAVIDDLEAAGFTGQFVPREGGRVHCVTCQHGFVAAVFPIDELRRLEGASDPDDMLAVAALSCPECSARGTLVLAYGPEASLDDSEVLAALGDPAHPPTPEGSPSPSD
jgi:hypothetical protein